jgi:ureidoglycolate lyase
MDGASALIVLAETSPDGSPDLVRARAFIAGPETPFLYAAGTWHAPLFAIGRGGAFLMAMHESGTLADCETFELRTVLRVVR